jgi:hypothetical protein
VAPSPGRRHSRLAALTNRPEKPRDRPLRDQPRRLELRRTGTGSASRWVHGSTPRSSRRGESSLPVPCRAPRQRPSLASRIGRHHTSNRHDHQRARFRPHECETAMRCWRRSSGPLGSRCRWIRGSSGDARRCTRWRNSSSTSALTGSSCPRKPAAATAPPGRHRLARACSWRSRRATTGRRREAPVDNGSGRPLDPRAPGHPLPRARIRARPGNVPLSPPD